MKKFIELMEKYLIPIANKIAGNSYIKSIGEGSMGLLSVIMFGAFFTVFKNIPWEPYQIFLKVTHIGDVIAAVPLFTTDMIGLYMAFSIAYRASHNFKIGEHAFSTGVVSLLSFLILTPINTELMERVSFIDASYLGAKGVFTAIIVALVSTKLMKLFVNKNITIKLPDGVPPMVLKSFTALIPVMSIGIIFATIKVIFAITSFNTATDFVYTMLQTPIQSLTGTLPAFLLIILIANLLWFFGIHGSMTVLPIFMPIMLGYMGENTAAVEAGKVAPNLISFALYDLANLGGSGATLGLVTIMFLFAKSERYKSFGKVVFPAGIFGVNEPVVFGMPIMLNVVLLIPFILTPVVIVSLGYTLMKIGIVTPPIGILGAGSLPPVISGLSQGSLSFGIYQLVAVVISGLIYYPFFKVLDNQALKEESQNN
ncbi:PTS sugar transporter subunit IIC [Tuanshanicoccus lijuaniae]|uniref:PTS sugar transporter subunit IIC n=1 Tax=Aerococcaceae bacterium zg-1292 TaxID=2774330 RepID=UPI001BD8875F|nr:PTS sugar transporter subunit IIC [Aerococcaceae bacterium zg-A91]MBS4457767.1 PTS sugar transporter subunit IIC [Aerococcaceae bacterium zg-BR33]